MAALVMLTLNTACAAGRLPLVAILATGGTIAGRGDSVEDVMAYKAGVVGIDELLGAVPEAGNYARLVGEQYCSIDSKDMTDAIWLGLARRVEALLASPDTDAVVITHGTDTMEETAYFLSLTVKSEKPVVLTGAMRPATARSADGPMNLLDAVRVAACGEAAGKGTLVVMDGWIHAARDVTKTHTVGIGAFATPDLGCLGHVSEEGTSFYRVPLRRHTTRSEFDVSGLAALPDVKIIYGHAGDDGTLVEAAVRAGAKGIVYAGTGNGSIHREAEKALAAAAARGVVVVRSSRVGSGAVLPAEPSYEAAGFVEGDTLNPQKARVLLQLALTRTKDAREVQRIFREY